MKKNSALLLLCLSVIAFALWWVTAATPTAKPNHAMPIAEVEFITITPQSFTLSKTLPGRTSAYRIAEIRPQVNGIVTKRLFREGSDVVAGQELYQIDPAPYQAAYDSAAADLLKAEATVISIEAKHARYKELVKIGAISQQDFDDATASLAQSYAQVAVAKAALSQAKINLNYTKVFSPISGRIGKSHVSEGSLVTANQEHVLAVVQQLDPIYVDVTQSSGDLLKLRRKIAASPSNAKPRVTLLMDKDSEVYEESGELQFSDITVDQSTGTVQLRILFPNPKLEILPGLFVRAEIEQPKETAATLVPQCAVSHHADKSVSVWVVKKDNTVAIQPIQVSQIVGDQWWVTSGLQAGDRVVVSGMQKIAPHIAVLPIEKQLIATVTEESK
jgi:membrane fusion protein (multidrug efflux system)